MRSISLQLGMSASFIDVAADVRCDCMRRLYICAYMKKNE
jgi:hypothetical protein